MGKLLWEPTEEKIKNSNMYRFMTFINGKFNTNFAEYTALYKWSVDNLPEFWASMWEFAEIKSSQPFDTVMNSQEKMMGVKWFEGARMNFAENLLRYRDDRVALAFKQEGMTPLKVTYKELYNEVAKVARSLRETGVVAGDRVVGFMPNMPQTIIAMLAATSIGAVWSSCSPDFGIKGVLDRFGQIKPKVLFTADGYLFKGKRVDSIERISDILSQLPSMEKVVVVPYTLAKPDISGIENSIMFDDYKSEEDDLVINFEQLPCDHPLYIMYSSGTTGLPKCMVQSAGGVLINQMKELLLHTDLKREDTIFYFTTCGWMMWNWLTTSLSVGATVVLFDGNPFHPGPDALWQMAEELGITVFGTSAGYIAALQNAGVKPKQGYDLSKLRAVLSTGSPLSEEDFDFVYAEVKKDIQLASISGGSDLNGCFALGNPIGPVYSGELQCRGLGMKVDSFDAEGKSLLGAKGELVCTLPFPSMPIYFWDDSENKRYSSAYFEVFDNIWAHGDYIEINEKGGVKIYGRSDATLNPGGVRIGTAEIYRQMDQVEEITDSLVVGQSWENDTRVILFVKMGEGEKLTEDLKKAIKTGLRTNASPRHVPAKIIAVPEIPYTHNMKKVELAVKKIIHGEPVLNKDSLSNPDALDYYADLEELSVA